jgi:hypothetical protein
VTQQPAIGVTQRYERSAEELYAAAGRPLLLETITCARRVLGLARTSRALDAQT